MLLQTPAAVNKSEVGSGTALGTHLHEEFAGKSEWPKKALKA